MYNVDIYFENIFTLISIIMNTFVFDGNMVTAFQVTPSK